MEKYPNRETIRAALIYHDLLRAVITVYQSWGIILSIDAAREIIAQNKHRNLLISDAITKKSGKRAAVYNEYSIIYHISESMIKKLKKDGC